MPRLLADDIAELAVGDDMIAQAVAARLRASGPFEEVVPGLCSVAVKFDPAGMTGAEAIEHLRAARAMIGEAETMPSRTIELAVRYGGEEGPDFDQAVAAAGLSPDAFIAAHAQTAHRVAMIGFTPGFAYLSGPKEPLAGERLSTPRARVAAGSVGLISGYTGLYALAGPGGWPIIGRVVEPLFDATAADPFQLQPGDQIIFKSAK